MLKTAAFYTWFTAASKKTLITELDDELEFLAHYDNDINTLLLPSLRSLRARCIGRARKSVQFIAQFSQLTQLEIVSEHCYAADLQPLSALTGLQSLSLLAPSHRIRPLVLQYFTASARTLCSLSVHGYSFVDGAQIRHFSRLRELRFNFCQQTTELTQQLTNLTHSSE